MWKLMQSPLFTIHIAYHNLQLLHQAHLNEVGLTWNMKIMTFQISQPLIWFNLLREKTHVDLMVMN